MKNKEPKQRLEKYSERFDNKDNEIVQGVFNPDTWGKRLIDDVSKEESQNLKNFKKLVSDEVSPAMKDFIKEKETTLEESKDLAYYKSNAEEDYLAVPISVLRYISKLEQQERSYSEEDMIKFMQFIVSKEELENTSGVSIDTAKYFLNKFKNKFKNK